MTNKNKLLDIAKRTFCLESAEWGRGDSLNGRSLELKEAAWMQRAAPSVGCFWDRHEENFRHWWPD